MIMHNDRWLGMIRHSLVREHGAISSNKPHKQAAWQSQALPRFDTIGKMNCAVDLCGTV